MVTIAPLTILVFVCNAVALTTALAMLFLVLWQGSRDRDNQLMGGYFASIVLWSGAIFLARLQSVLGVDPETAFLTTCWGRGLNSLALFAVVSHYADLWQRRSVLLFIASGVLCTVVFTPLLFQGTIVDFHAYLPDGRLAYDVRPVGYVALGYYLLFDMGAIGCLWRYRRSRAGKLMLGGFLVAASALLTGLFPAIRPYPLPAVAAALTSILFGRAILREKIFNPLERLNRELAEANQRLRKSEGNLTAVIENSRAGIWSVDRRYRLITANTRVLMFWKAAFRRDVRPGNDALAHLPESERRPVAAAYERALRGESFVMERRFDLSPTLLEFEATFNPIWEGQEIVGVCVYAWDVTERKQAERELRRLQESLRERNAQLEEEVRQRGELIAELDAFAYTAAHDLKSPLAPIVTYGDILREDPDGVSEEERAEFLDVIVSNAQKAGEIIDALLLLSRVRATEIERHPVDMAQIVAIVLERLELPIRAYAAEIDVAGYWPPALGYAPWIEEVWTNYVSNALKYGGRPPRLRLRASAGATHNEYWVEDNGRGLTPEQRERLFTPFTRLDARLAEGHGLGLSIVRRIVEKLGGEVTVRSEPGHGSVFGFTLPAAEKSANE